MPSSLYQLWQKTVALSPDATAVTVAASGKSHTFAQLDAAVSKCTTQFPCGSGSDFILQTLAAWRDGLATCPLEGDAAAPDLGKLPPSTAHLKTTSGSCGAPRLILFTAAQLAADAANIVTTMGLGPDRPNIGVISMAHSYGFSNLVLPLLLHGVPLVLGGDPLPGSFSRSLTFLPDPGACVPAVPAMWRAWLKAGCLDANKIRIAISAGAPLTTELESAIYHQARIKVHNFYGSSECGGIAYDRTDTPREDQGIVGTPMDGVTVATDQHGCLVVHGGAVGETYWPDQNPAIQPRQFTTQDLAQIAADGTIHLSGRAGDLINIAGRKLDPASIESELQKLTAVDHCVVFGIPSPDPERVQEIVAICNSGAEAQLKAQLARALPAWQRIRHWWITADLQPDARGKISRATWREKWLEANKTL